VVEGEGKRAEGSTKGAARAQERWGTAEETKAGMQKVEIPVETTGDLFVG
jgi:hypothetical protein